MLEVVKVSKDLTEDGVIGKTVGKRSVGDPLCPNTNSKERAREWHDAFGRLMVPRGVYRFSSHEEADEWMWKMISRPKVR